MEYGRNILQLFIKEIVSLINSCKIQLNIVGYYWEVYFMISFGPSKRLRETTRLLIRKLGVLERSEATCCGITLTQCHTIIEIGRREQITVNELSELLNLDKSTVSRTAEQLVNNDILIREPNQNDRRYVALRLTDKGEELFGNIEQRMEAYFAELIASIPEEKREQVIESLQLFSEALQKNDVVDYGRRS